MGNQGLSTRRFLRVIFFILLSSLGVYWIITKTLHPAAHLNPLLGSGLTALAAATAISIFFVRFVYIEKLLREDVGDADSAKLPQVRQAYILAYVLCDMVGLIGFTLYAMGGGAYRATLFFLAAAGLFVFCYPQLGRSGRTDR
jgi:hypothetical protein